ncbi:MAG TPA: CHASE3 domain-containing protein [Blastocatellia bacterium]|jgi:CHASE3 domain sensor protein
MAVKPILESLRYLRGRRIYISKKSIAAFVALGLAGVLTLALIVYNLIRFRHYQAWVSHTRQVIGEIRGLHAAVVEAETGQSRFVITQDGDYLDNYKGARASAYAQVEKMETLTADNPNQRALIREVREAIDARLATLATGIELRGAQGLDVTRQAMLTGTGKRQMDGIRELITRMENEEMRLLRARAGNVRAQWVQTLAMLITPLPLALIFLFLIGALVNKDMVDKVKEMEERQAASEAILRHTEGVRALMKKEDLTFDAILSESERLLKELEMLARALPN